MLTADSSVPDGVRNVSGGAISNACEVWTTGVAVAESV